ncbi:histone deacetylase domain-containing protein, partial [Lineolata rhizophorae]
MPLSRRSSSTFLGSSPGGGGRMGMPLAEEKEEEGPKVKTAGEIAADWFEREMTGLQNGDANTNASAAPHSGIAAAADGSRTLGKAIVILHDQCYGHRFSRPRTAKWVLSSIVERPERIQAAVLGLAAAYVRLGGRHAEGRCPPTPLPPAASSNGASLNNSMAPAPFRIKKSSRELSLLDAAVTNVHGKKWMEELGLMCAAAGERLAAAGNEVSRVAVPTSNSNTASGAPTTTGTGKNSAKDKDKGTDEDERPEIHKGDLYLCPESLSAFQGALGGVCDGIDAVFRNAQANKNNSSIAAPTRAFVCIRPPGHHCSADYPSGFCWLNNVHVGIEYATRAYGLTHAAILDFDLHHGDGSQAIAWAHNARPAPPKPKQRQQWGQQQQPQQQQHNIKTHIGYFSLHDINSYPCEDGDEDKIKNASLCIEGAHGQSVWNVHLQPWKDRAEFWALYEARYKVLVDKARVFLAAHTARLRAAGAATPPKAAIFVSAGFDASEWEGQGMRRHKVNVPTEFYARFTRDVVALAEEEGTGVEGRVVSVLEGGYSDRALMTGIMSHVSALCAPPEEEDEGGRKGENAPGANAVEGVGFHGVKIKQEEDEDDELNEAMKGLLRGPVTDGNNVVANGTPTTEDITPYSPTWWSLPTLTHLDNTINPPPPPAPSKKPKAAAPPTYCSPTQSFTAKVVDPAKIRRSVSGPLRGGAPLSASPSRAP